MMTEEAKMKYFIDQLHNKIEEKILEFVLALTRT